MGSGDKREMGYVASSRHRKDLRLYVDRSVYDVGKNLDKQTQDKDKFLKDIARSLTKSDEKELAITVAHRGRETNAEDTGHGH